MRATSTTSIFRFGPLLGIIATLLCGSSSAQGPIHLTYNKSLGDSGLAAATKATGSPQIAAIGDTFLMAGDTYAAKSVDQGRDWESVDIEKVAGLTSPALGSIRLVSPRRFKMALVVANSSPSTPTSSNLLVVTYFLGAEDLRELRPGTLAIDAKKVGALPGQNVRVRDAASDDNWLYISLEVHSTVYHRSAVVRFSLDDIYRHRPVTRQIFTSDRIGGAFYAFARGCSQEMFFADTHSTTAMNLYRWNAVTNSITSYRRTITRWYNRRSVTRLPDGKNWLANADHQVVTGYRRSGEVGFLFESNRGGIHKEPFIRVCRFKESDLRHLRDHDIANNRLAWAFPAIAVDFHGNLGFTASLGGSFQYPAMVVGVLDSSNNWDWDQLTFRMANYSNRSPSDEKWGYRFGILEHPLQDGSYLATGLTLRDGNTDPFARHHFVWFSRSSQKPVAVDLTVQSQPVGVNVQVSPPDIDGKATGLANFTRRFWKFQNYRISTASQAIIGGQRWVFDRWKLNGVDQPVGVRVIDRDINIAPDTAVAIFKPVFRVLVTSENEPNVSFELDKADVFGDKDGVTPAYRYFAPNEDITVEPAWQGGNRNLHHLEVNGARWTPNRSQVATKVDRDLEIKGVYGYQTFGNSRPFGTPCHSTNGRPLQVTGGGTDIGDTHSHRLVNLAPNTNVFAAIGTSNQVWNGLTLPFNFPGTACAVLVAPDFVLGLTSDSGGKVSVALPIPNDKRLLGSHYYLQFAILDPSLPAGLTTSEGQDTKIGGWDLR